MKFLKSLKEIYKFFLKIGIRKKRTILFSLLSFTPVLLIFIVKILEIAKPHSSISASHLYPNVIVAFYIQFIIEILAIFFGSSIIDEEVDNKTLVYLNTKPIEKVAVFIGKFLSYLTIILSMVIMGLIFTFLIAYFNNNMIGRVGELIKYLYASVFAILAYTSIFAMLSTFFKRTAMLGLLFVFGWESIVNYMPGSTQKLTIIHFVKSLIPQTAVNKQFLLFHLEPSSILTSVLVLLSITLISIIIGAIIFKYKEYVI